MGFVQGVHRDQLVMFPESLDEYVSDENPVRFVDAFVDSLDLQVVHSLSVPLGGFRVHL
jgi:transposase